MKTGWKTIMVAAIVLALAGGLVIAGPGGPGRGRGPGYGRGPGMGMGMGMGPGMGMGMGMGPGMGMGMGMGPGMGLCMQAGGPMGPPHRNALGAIGAWLNLTDEQKAQIRQIQEQGKADAEAAQEAVVAARDALHDAVIGGAAEADIRAAATALGEAIGNQAVVHAKTVAAAKAVLTDEQRTKFDELKAKLPALRQRMPHAQGPFCPWADPNQAAQAPLHSQGLGGPIPLEQMFKAADTNKDGKLTMEELQAFRAARGGAQVQHQQ